MKIKSILVSQPAPNESSPYLEIAKKEKVKIIKNTKDYN